MMERDICHTETSVEEKAADLTSKITFEEWSTSLLRSLCHELNEEGVSLAYVLRKSEPPKSFSSLHEKLEYLIPLKTTSAQFHRDSNRICTKIEGLIKNDMIKPLL